MLQEVASARRVALLEVTDNGFLEKEKARRAQKRQQRLDAAGGGDAEGTGGSGGTGGPESGAVAGESGHGEGDAARQQAPGKGKARRGSGVGAEAPSLATTQRKRPALETKEDRKRIGKKTKSR